MKLFPEPSSAQRARSMRQLRRILRWTGLFCFVVSALAIFVADKPWDGARRIIAIGAVVIGVLLLVVTARDWEIERDGRRPGRVFHAVAGLAIAGTAAAVPAIVLLDPENVTWPLAGSALLWSPIGFALGVAVLWRGIRRG